MDDLAVTDIVATLVTTDGRPLAADYWWANSLRGALGHSLRYLLCRRKGTPCVSCAERSQCGFPRLWQPQRTEQAGTHGPRFRLAPWILRAKVSGDTLEVLVRLFGPATADSWRWRVALELAAARGIGPHAQSFRTSAPPRIHESTVQHLTPPPPGASDRLTVRLLSPLRLIADGVPAEAAPTFRHLLAAAERRLRLAKMCWGGLGSSPRLLDPATATDVATVAASTKWCDLPRYSRRQRRLMHLGGLTGEITYGPGWAPFWPILGPAAVLHLGKFTTAGLGEIAFAPG